MIPPPAAASRVDHNYVDDLLIEFDLVFDDEDPLGLRRGLRFGCHPSPLRWNRDASRSDQSNDDAAALGHWAARLTKDQHPVRWCVLAEPTGVITAPQIHGPAHGFLSSSATQSGLGEPRSGESARR